MRTRCFSSPSGRSSEATEDIDKYVDDSIQPGVENDVDENQVASQNECVVRFINGEPHLTISLYIGGMFKTLSRMQGDEVGEAYDRLQAMATETSNSRYRQLHKVQKKKKPKGKGKRRLEIAEAAASATEEARNDVVSQVHARQLSNHRLL